VHLADTAIDPASDPPEEAESDVELTPDPDELEPDELVPDEELGLVGPVPDDVPEFDPDVPELVASSVPELDPCSLEPAPPWCVPPPQAARATQVAVGATRRDRVRMASRR